jgi:peroxiredoxin
MTGFVLGMLGAALILVTGVRWLRQMRRVQIPADMRGYLLATGAAALLGAIALAFPAGVFGTLAALFGLVGGLLFLGLYAASGQQPLTPAVAPGGPVLDFTATDDAGQPFALASLRGRPFLLKFFRGHWCPYCVAELRRWEELRPELDGRGIAVVTVCADTPEEIRRGRGKHGLRAAMLADPDLAVTDRYHLRNPRNFAPRPGVVIPLPIPTTILVDAAGTVRWIDQATDYMHRSDPERVLAAIRTHLDPLGGAARATVQHAARA